ncbi:metal ABC transporter ATP-binding protein [Sulfitobacter albidus]|uniref:Metal ABC transporter ATP-binding protein n=1 Tax=Sulfitobacter albidus TaxID=2829501 RepID=A0A975JF41_9RHOB|nr:metal ABC transporter ATP-binding protein [Sulfitobacter albidus]QUJ77356.1 metal ABC transporter ATP-binding protein [Sulfitobacter albidus]
MSRLITTDALTLAYGATPVLRDVDMHIDRGEIVTIVGPNGSGKSSLLRGLIGALPAFSGTVTRAPALRVGYVPQSLAVDATLPLTVARFLNLPSRVARADWQAALVDVGAEALADRQIRGLSGGQLQRVLLARALLGAPDLLMLDEPTQGLDQPGAAQFYRLIEEVRRTRGCAVLMVSHDLHVVMAASDRVLCLNGHLCCQGTPKVVADAPEYRALFGSGTRGALALYQHDHDHDHHPHDCSEHA